MSAGLWIFDGVWEYVMIKIAVCDDDEKDLKNTSEIIEKIIAEEQEEKMICASAKRKLRITYYGI